MSIDHAIQSEVAIGATTGAQQQPANAAAVAAGAYRKPYVLNGVPELDKATWEWTTETATHALRLIMTGVFDRFPRVQVISGHMGETLPYMPWRLDSRYLFTHTDRRVQRAPSEYIRDNFHVTTSGQFSDVPLHAALASIFRAGGVHGR